LIAHRYFYSQGIRRRTHADCSGQSRERLRAQAVDFSRKHQTCRVSRASFPKVMRNTPSEFYCLIGMTLVPFLFAFLSAAALRCDLLEENSAVISGDKLITSNPRSAFHVQFTRRFCYLSFLASLQDFNLFIVSLCNPTNSFNASFYCVQKHCVSAVLSLNLVKQIIYREVKINLSMEIV